MENLQITMNTILEAFGMLALVAGGVKVILQMFAPFKNLVKRMEKCEARLNKHDQFLANDQTAMKEIRSAIRENSRINLALLNHFIDGNGVEEMKELRKETQDRLLGDNNV